MNEKEIRNRRNDALRVVENIRHRALRSPQAERLAEYVANLFETTNTPEICISYPTVCLNGQSRCRIELTYEDKTAIGLGGCCDMYYKREKGRYYITGDDDCQKCTWMDITDTIIPCKYATDQVDLSEKYFILEHLGYDVRRGRGAIYIRLPQVKYVN